MHIVHNFWYYYKLIRRLSSKVIQRRRKSELLSTSCIVVFSLILIVWYVCPILRTFFYFYCLRQKMWFVDCLDKNLKKRKEICFRRVNTNKTKKNCFEFSLLILSPHGWVYDPWTDIKYWKPFHWENIICVVSSNDSC